MLQHTSVGVDRAQREVLSSVALAGTGLHTIGRLTDHRCYRSFIRCVKAGQDRLQLEKDSGERLAQDRTPRTRAGSDLPDGWNQATDGLV